MYTENGNGYYGSGGQQCVRRGDFILLIQPERDRFCEEPIKVLVRKVAMKQLGHWMMGSARIYGETVTVSGSYGSDGLPKTVPDHIYDRAVLQLPDELKELWNKGGGWNGAGSEAEEIKKWVRKNLPALKK